MLSGVGLPLVSAAPTDPVTRVDRLSVDQAEQATTITSPGGAATVTTTMTGVAVKPVVDIIFVIDTTASMNKVRGNLTLGVSQFVQNVAAAGGQDIAFGIYYFGDIVCGDVFGWKMPLTPLGPGASVDAVTYALSHLPNNDGCADGWEDSVWAGMTALNTAPWRPGAQHEEIVLTDQSSHARTGYPVAGLVPTQDNWKAMADDKDVHVTLVNASGYPAEPQPDAPGSYWIINTQVLFGSDYTVSPVTPPEYVDYLTKAVVFGGAPSFTVVPTVSVTYADGSPSTDLIAVLDPPGASTTVETTPVAFTLHAVAAQTKDVVRPGATSTAYVEFVEQRTGSVVARQTVTFTAPNPQTVRVVFVDDDNGGAPVTPVAGFKVTYTGLPGTAVGFTEALARAGVPAGYAYQSMNNVATYDDDAAVDQEITVHVKHAMNNSTVTSVRTIHYTGAGAKTPADLPQTITWDSVTDAVSGVTTYTAKTAAYPESTSPVIPGYTADFPVVAALSVTSPTPTAPAPVGVTVKYTPNTQVVNVVFLDDGVAGELVDPVDDFQSTLTGPSGSPVGFTQAMAESGIPAGYVFVSLENVSAYDFDDAVHQTIIVHVEHELTAGTVTTARTITYTGAGTSTPAAVRQPITWDTVTDAVTGVTTYTPKSAAYPARTSPVIDGYAADVLVVPALSVAASTTAPVSVDVPVKYTPNTQVVNVVFVDDDAAGAVVEPVKDFQARRTGPSGSSVGFTDTMAEAGVPSGYVLASVDNVDQFDFKDGADQTITVHLVHALTRGTVTTTRTVKYAGAASQTPPDVTQPVTWTTVRDEVTRVTTYTASQTGYAAVTSPVIPGYTADLPAVAALPVTSPATTAPGSVTVTVTYTPNTQVVNVVFVDDDASGAVVAPVAGFRARLTGPSGSNVGFTSAMAEAGIPAGYVFVSLVNVPAYDFVDGADQTITVHLGHGLSDGTVTTNRTIHYTGAGTRTPADVRQPVSWNTVTDAVTNVTTYTPKSSGYPAVTSAVIDGYTADLLVVPALGVASQTTAPQPVDVTVTYAPNTQVVSVVFVDDDAAGAAVVPVAGFQVRLTGLSGSNVGFTSAMAEAGIPAGYVFVSLDNVIVFDYADAADQQITVHLKHRLDEGTLATTRTVHYTGAVVSTPADVIQTLLWGTVADAVTGVTTYTAQGAGYAAVTSPVIDGYTADPLVVAASAVKSPATTVPVSSEVTVRYAPNTQVVLVVFVDDESAGAVVTPVAGFQARLTGLSGSAVGFSQAMARAGVPPAYVFESMDNVDTYDFADGVDQRITVHLKHGYEVTALTTVRSINYRGAGDFTPAGVTQRVNWVVTKDLPSGVIVYTTSDTGYAAVPSPALNGYTPDVEKVDAADVPARTLTQPLSVETWVTYRVNPQRVNVRFVDDADNGSLVSPTTGFEATLTGPGATDVGFTMASAQAGTPVGYVVTSLDNVSAYDLDDQVDQTITVHLTHLMVTENLPVTRTIHYTGAGNATPADEVQTVGWTVTTDAVTKVTVYTTDATGYAQVAAPALDGYTVDKALVEFLPVPAKTDVRPVSTSVLVTYTKIEVQTGGQVSGSAPVPLLWLTMLLMGTGAAGAGWVLRRQGKQ